MKRYLQHISLTAIGILVMFISVADASAQVIGLEKVQHQEIIDALANGQEQDILVLFDESAAQQTAATMRMTANVAHDTAAILATKAAMYKSLKQTVMESMPINDVETLQDYSHLPMTFLKLKAINGLQALLKHPSIIRVYKNETRELLLSQSLPLINQPTVAGAGFVGTGTAVAVLDTGVDYTRAAFGYCTAPNTPAGCKVKAAFEFAPQDYSLDDNGHGTNVAGIVLGVAPDSRILDLDVFRTDGKAYGADVIAAINWSIANKITYNIVAMNLSLGGGGFSSPCNSDIYASPISNARNAGILASIASGNEGYTDSISSPACVPSAISVGAVYDSNVGSQSWANGCTDNITYADLVTCFSNSASFLTMLAPGSIITAAGIFESGTSQAAPHVAGAIAVLRGSGAYPSETVAEIVARLTNTGVPVTDPGNGITKPRLDLLEAYNYDVTPPPAPISLNANPTTWTNINSFSINWTNPSDFSGIAGAYYKIGSVPISNTDGTYTTSKPFNASASAQGGQSIYVWLKDGAGNISQYYATATLYYDGTAPSYSWNAPASVAFYKNGNTISVDATITESGGSGMTNGANCNAKIDNATSSFTGSVTYSTVTGKCTGTLTLGNPSGLSDGSRNLTLQVADNAGNSAVSTARSINIDNTAPSTTDNSSSTWSSTSPVVVTLSPGDGSGSGIASTKYCIDTSNSCTPATIGTSASVSCSSGADCTQYVRYSSTDNKENVEITKSSNQIRQDRKVPTGSVTINSNAASANTTSVNLTLSATDTGSGVTQMCISDSTSCSAWEAYATSRPWTLPAGDGTKTVYALFKDSVGNVSTQGSDTILLDTTPPANGSLNAVRADSQVNLSWSGFTDSASGISSYKLVYSTVGSPADCSGSALYTGSGASYPHSGLTNGTTYYYRLCAADNAGNISSGAIAQATPEEITPPTGTITINAGAAATNDPNVTLTISATDPSGVTHMCISNTTSCTSWEIYATSKSWALVAGDGTKTVYAWFRDSKNNDNLSPVSDTIILDTVAPNTSITSKPPVITNATTANFSFTSSEASSTFECQLDSSGFQACTLPKSYAALSNGSHTFDVRAIDQAANVDATPASYAWTIDTTLPVLTVAKTGTGSGAVTSSPTGIDCGATCSAPFPWLASVTLTAEPASNNIFTGWSEPSCPGTAPCIVTMDAGKTITANFEPYFQWSDHFNDYTYTDKWTYESVNASGTLTESGTMLSVTIAKPTAAESIITLLGKDKFNAPNVVFEIGFKPSKTGDMALRLNKSDTDYLYARLYYDAYKMLKVDFEKVEGGVVSGQTYDNAELNLKIKYKNKTLKIVKRGGDFNLYVNERKKGDILTVAALGAADLQVEIENKALYPYGYKAQIDYVFAATPKHSGLPADQIKLITPNGGETIKTGSLYLVEWEAPADVPYFMIEYSIDGGIKWKVIESGIQGSNYVWKLSKERPYSTYKLRVTGHDASGISVGTSDISDAPFVVAY